MACLDRYAQAFDYYTWYLCGGLRVGYDNSGGAGNAFLTDTTVNFLQPDAVQVGAPCYNATRKTYGVVTARAATVLQTSNTWSNGDEYHVALIGARERVTIETYLRLAASDINAARMATGGCACSPSDEALAYLSKLNIIDAAIHHRCPCARPDISDEERASLLQWITVELDNIRTGAIELCPGHTGSGYPSFGIAQRAWNEWTAVEIMINRQSAP